MKRTPRLCLLCSQPIKGRSDKKFCNTACKNAFHHDQKVEQESHFRETDRIIRQNYRILLGLLGTAHETVLEPLRLDAVGFKWEYVTRIFKNKQGCEYYVLYDCAWTRVSEMEVRVIRK